MTFYDRDRERWRHNDRWCSTSPSPSLFTPPRSPSTFTPALTSPSSPFLRLIPRFASGIRVITRRVYSVEFVTFITQFLAFQINCLIRATAHTRRGELEHFPLPFFSFSFRTAKRENNFPFSPLFLRYYSLNSLPREEEEGCC